MYKSGCGAKKMAIYAVLSALWVTSCGIAWAADAPVAKTSGKPALTVKVASVRPLQMGMTITANGGVQAWQESVISAEISGLRIAEVHANVGDQVQRGEVLAILDDETLRASEAEARAALQESEAVLADAKANAERSKKLSASGFVSDQQANQSTTSEATAKARVEVQRARHQSALLRLSQARIVAPDSGVISAASAAVGSLSQPGVELFRLIRKGHLEWRAELTADELALMRQGMNAEITTNSGRVVIGKVRAISPYVNPQTRYGYALIRLPDDAGVIAGTYLRGTFDVSGGKKSVPTLPQSAVLQRGSKTYVLVVGTDNHVHERAVTLGMRNAERVEIRQGLAEGEPVVESGGAFLTEGDVVQVVKG